MLKLTAGRCNVKTLPYYYGALQLSLHILSRETQTSKEFSCFLKRFVVFILNIIAKD